ncbi:hypothetical protein OSB04_032002 [Centaurea solstitialis]|uniref:Uncharacterized protein n=1 Tax=Centaurea solstitialis TaxID=347529 RepID=A0AA38W6K6_9ASTR|nr:hypothetical protein OSB04_032002 [Centaurea solstitialis]
MRGNEWRHRHVSGQPQPAPTVRTPLPTQVPGDPMPSGRMRGSLTGDELAAAQRRFLSPPQQPDRAIEPWSRTTPTLPVELRMQHSLANSENTPNGSKFRFDKY